jgi:hypothetical protein
MERPRLGDVPPATATRTIIVMIQHDLWILKSRSIGKAYSVLAGRSGSCDRERPAASGYNIKFALDREACVLRSSSNCLNQGITSSLEPALETMPSSHAIPACFSHVTRMLRFYVQIKVFWARTQKHKGLDSLVPFTCESPHTTFLS